MNFNQLSLNSKKKKKKTECFVRSIYYALFDSNYGDLPWG